MGQSLSRFLLLLVALLCWALPLRADPAVREACSPTDHLADPRPILGHHGPARDATDRSVEPFTLVLMQAAASWRGRRDSAAARHAVVEMVKWAGDDALAGGDEVPARAARSGEARRKALAGILGAWLDLRASPAGRAEAGRIEPWLARLVAREEKAAPNGNELRGNELHGDELLVAVILAQWALVSGRDDLAARAHTRTASAARATLEAMQPDGSLPSDMARGLRALASQRRTIALLVYLGELQAAAEPSGAADLWQPRADGADLHRAVAFFVRALDRPAVLGAHLDSRLGPQAVRHQDLGFLVARGNGRHDLAWVELYRARFPDRPEAAALARRLPRPGDPGWPLVDELAGGNTTCRVRVPARHS